MLIKYNGSVSYEEYPVTSFHALWQPGNVQDVSVARYTTLLATGKFSQADLDIFTAGNSGIGLISCTSNATAVSTASANTLALQSYLNGNNKITISTPGIYAFDNYLEINSNTHIEIGKGVILLRVPGNSNASLFRNKDTSTGNTNIFITGKGTIYGNANGYVATYDANPVDCPYIPELYAANIAGIRETGSTSSTNPGGFLLPFDNVDGLEISGLTLMQAVKYHIYGSKISNSKFKDLVIYADDIINPANGSSLGRDGIHIQGNSENIIIENITGTTNDDMIALNVRDIGIMVTPRSTGPIRSVQIKNIKAKNQRRGGTVVHIYGGLDVGTLDGANTNGYDVAPTVTGITQTGGVATVTTSSAHNMKPGDHFYLTGATITGYNTGTAKANQSLPLASVLATPSDTTFTYYVASGTASPATGTMPTLVRYYAMQNIQIENVNATTFAGPAVTFSVTTDSSSNYAVFDGIKVDGVASRKGAGATAGGCVNTYFGRLINPTFKNLTTYDDYLAPALDTTFNESYCAGTLTIDNPVAAVGYKPYTSSGTSWINLGIYDSAIINKPNAEIFNAGGGYRHMITLSSNSKATLTVNSPTIRGMAGGLSQLIKSAVSNVGSIIINQPSVDSQTTLVDLGSSGGGGTVTVNDAVFNATAGVDVFKFNSTISDCKLNLNNCISSTGAGNLLLSFSGAGTANKVKLNACELGAMTIVSASSTGTAPDVKTATYA